MTDKVNKARFGGRASDAPDRTMTLQHNQLGAFGSGAQLRARRKDGLTPERHRIFLETLAGTCNVSEAARVAGINLSTAYYHKRRSSSFAREWARALDVGYAELQTQLLRQSLFGVEEEEIVLDGEGAVKSRKIRKSYPHRIAALLLEKHAVEVEREAGRLREKAERPDGDDAVERLRAALEAVRAKGEDKG